MNNEQKQQAKHLYFQTNLSKTEIANYLNVSRRSVHYWIKEGNWQRLKQSAEHMPAMLAENCYHIFAHLSQHLLSERRVMRPVTYQEANTLHKLTITIKNLKNRQTVNESIEMLAYFMESVNRKAPELAHQLMPHVEDYLATRAGVCPEHFLPEGFNEQGYRMEQQEDPEELKLDLQDIFDWENPVFDQEQFYNKDETAPAEAPPAHQPQAAPAQPQPAPQPVAATSASAQPPMPPASNSYPPKPASPQPPFSPGSPNRSNPNPMSPHASPHVRAA